MGRAGVRVGAVTRVAAVTGEDSANRTGSRFGVYGTDLGIMWDNGRHEVLVAFGDSYGSEWGGHGAGPAHADWRCNFLARTTATDLDAGLPLEPVATRPDGAAAEALGRDPDTDPEVTVIPTAGIAVGEVNYLHYMSVAQWHGPGRWRTNHGGIAVSEDGGVSWRKPASARWPADRRRRGLFDRQREHPVQMGAFVAAGEHVYLFGTPSGRFGSATLARVEPAAVLDAAAWRYWDGRDFGADDPFDARPVIPGPLGELSVQFHEPTQHWLALHLDEPRAALVLRSAPRLTGPWSPGQVVAAATDHPAPYGGYLHPWALNGPHVYFTLSQWGPYNVTLLRAELLPG
jgi:hypothetical protein